MQKNRVICCDRMTSSKVMSIINVHSIIQDDHQQKCQIDHMGQYVVLGASIFLDIFGIGNKVVKNI